MKTQNLILSGFIGFTLGVCSMMMVNVDTQSGCYKTIQDIEYQVCEDCWYDVFDEGEKYKEVEEYTTWE